MTTGPTPPHAFDPYSGQPLADPLGAVPAAPAADDPYSGSVFGTPPPPSADTTAVVDTLPDVAERRYRDLGVQVAKHLAVAGDYTIPREQWCQEMDRTREEMRAALLAARAVDGGLEQRVRPIDNEVNARHQRAEQAWDDFAAQVYEAARQDAAAEWEQQVASIQGDFAYAHEQQGQEDAADA